MKTKSRVAPTGASDTAATAQAVAASRIADERPAILPRERSAVVKALAAGLVPNVGLNHLAVGRERETQALMLDVEDIKAGGASFRVIDGQNGAGKTFLQHLVQSRAIQQNLVVVAADLSVNHRLHATDGRGRSLLSSLMANVYTRACPSGNGLRSLLESWISDVATTTSGEPLSPEALSAKIDRELRSLKDFPLGFDLATVLSKYNEGHVNDNPALQDAVLRWLRAEYSTKTEARQELGVRRIIGDEDIYAALKLFAAFCKQAGYSGLLVMLDELSALTHRLSLARARQANVQILLTIINECFQGGVSGLGFILAGTPDSLEDPERGLFSVPALRSRLQTCSPAGCIDVASPVIHLEPLGREELLVLLHNVRRVHALGDATRYRLPDEALEMFLDRAVARLGRRVLANPREVLRPYVSILSILEQEPERPWQELMAKGLETPPADPAEGELKDLKLKP